ncbi:MAG: hypothetical protein ACE5K0_11465 [Candidatus Methanofastidiosia archaeon]
MVGNLEYTNKILKISASFHDYKLKIFMDGNLIHEESEDEVSIPLNLNFGSHKLELHLFDSENLIEILVFRIESQENKISEELKLIYGFIIFFLIFYILSLDKLSKKL